MKYGLFDAGLRICSVISILIFSLLLILLVVSRSRSPGFTPAPPVLNPAIITKLPPGTEPGNWKVIIIHHSETPDESLSRTAARYTAMGFKGIPFHFIVHSNGSVEATSAWKLQVPVPQTMDRDYFNAVSIGICVMGDFSRSGSRPSSGQISGLIRLTRNLMDTFRIKKVRVLQCSEIDDTLSPGTNFPWRRFLRSL